MRTRSLWGSPPARYYRFIKLVEESIVARPLAVSILGCSDGKFVLPVARKGHRVLAVDIDEVALFGGLKACPTGQVRMAGLVNRLQAEGLEENVHVVHGDFVEYSPTQQSHATFTSGSIQYSYNLKHRLAELVQRIQDYVAPGGFVYIDYMLPLEEKHLARENFIRKGGLAVYFPKDTWTVRYDRVLGPLFEKGHVDNPADHYHHWGHFCARRGRYGA